MSNWLVMEMLICESSVNITWSLIYSSYECCFCSQPGINYLIFMGFCQSLSINDNVVCMKKQ